MSPREKFRRAAAKTTAILTATNPARRKTLLKDQKDAELTALAEQNLERGDLVPLARFVFEGQSAPASSAAPPLTNERLTMMRKTLHTVMVQEMSVITSWCSRNASQMRTALESVSKLQGQANTMADGLRVSHSRLAVAGQSVVDNLTELAGAAQVAAHVRDAQRAVRGVRATVAQLAKAAKHISADDLHLALTLLNDVQKANPLLRLNPLPEQDGHADLAALSKGEYAVLSVLNVATHSLLAALRQRVQRNFHSWLAATRAAARGIGERAVRRAAAQRSHEDLLSRERKMLQGLLIRQKDLKKAKELVLHFISQEDPAFGRSSIKQRSAGSTAAPTDASALLPPSGRGDVADKRFRRPSVRAGRMVDVDESANAVSLLEDVELAELHRCMHVHAMLGDVQAFRDYYHEQRHLQLLADLAPPASVLESHRAYLAHVAGFFLMELAVLHSAAALVRPARLQSLWATALSSVRAAADTGFHETSSAAAMVIVKDAFVLAANALEGPLYDTTPIIACLAQYRDRYHELLNFEVATSVRATLQRDLKPLTVATEAQAEDTFVATGLPRSLDPDAPPPPLPCQAPFSAALPQVIAGIEGYIADSLQFFSGLLSGYELLGAMREARDRFVCRLLSELLVAHAHKLAHQPGCLQPLILMAGDAACLAHVLRGLDEFTIVVMRGSEAHAEDDLALVLRALTRRGVAGGSHGGAAGGRHLGTSGGSAGGAAGGSSAPDDAIVAITRDVQQLQDKLEVLVSKAAADELLRCAEEAVEQSWTPDEALPDEVSPFMVSIIATLEAALGLSGTTMAPPARKPFAKAAFAAATRAAGSVLTAPEPPALNAHGIRRFASDVDALLQLAARHGHEGTLAALDNVAGFLTRESWAVAAQPEQLVATYPGIDPALLVAAMRKYEPLKTGYMERIRATAPKQASKGEVAGYTRALEAAMQHGGGHGGA